MLPCYEKILRRKKDKNWVFAVALLTTFFRCMDTRKRLTSHDSEVILMLLEFRYGDRYGDVNIKVKPYY